MSAREEAPPEESHAGLRAGPRDGLYFERQPPTEGGVTFVMFNALTGDTSAWEAVIAPDAHMVDLPDVGHLVTMERPQAVVAACLGLVERLG
jgi:pimeloyl-ACP methyl ester carboxylesterase